jgi:hypothetical protein
MSLSTGNCGRGKRPFAAAAGLQAADHGSRIAWRNRACIFRCPCYYANVIDVPDVGIEELMEMTVTSIAAESLASRCAICARPVRRGASLCAQCKAAVKRARQVPSLPPGFLPRAGTGTVAAQSARRSDPHALPARRATRAGTPPVPGGWGIYATLIAFGAAVSVTGYFATDRQEEEASRGRVALAARATSVAESRTDGGSRVPAQATSGAADEPAPDEDVSAQIEWTVPPAPLVRSEGGSPRGNPARNAWNAPAGSTPSATSLRNPVRGSPLAQAGPAGAVAAPTGESEPETQAVPVSTPDRWQLLAAATSQCERENVLVGFFCRERARLKYCEGHWGAAPQCPTVALGKSTR